MSVFNYFTKEQRERARNTDLVQLLRRAQAFQTVVAGVGRTPFLQGGDSCLADIPRSYEIRLANPEGDDVLAAGNEVKELADAGFGEVDDLFRENAVPVHGLLRGLR